MRLTWNKEYEDYTDTANWQPRYEELCLFAEAFTMDWAEEKSDEILLDSLDMLEELLRFYCAESNMAKLEPVMRKFNSLLNLCRQRGMTGVEIRYMEMLFLRVNAMLYRMHGQHRQSADGYDRCVEAAGKCFQTMKASSHLSGEQTAYVAWSCIECFKEASEIHDIILDIPGTLRLLREAVSLLEWMDKFLVDRPGICDQASELYAGAAGMFYQYGDTKAGGSCYRQASRLLNALDAVWGSDFYRARAIWLMSIHGTMAFHTEGDTAIMLQCEKEAHEYLRQRYAAKPRDLAIVESAKAAIGLQRSSVVQQSGKLDNAIAIARDAIRALEESFAVVQADYEGRNDYHASVMSRIASRINNIWVGSKETLGDMLFQSGDIAGSEAAMKEVLDNLTKTSGIRMTGSGAVLIQSEVLQYLGMIAAEHGDPYQTDFYGTQSADMAFNLGKESGNANAWGLAVGSCSLVAETALAMKNKPKAAQYADLGLKAADALAKANPNHYILSLRRDLEKYYKKANRRFF